MVTVNSNSDVTGIYNNVLFHVTLFLVEKKIVLCLISAKITIGFRLTKKRNKKSDKTAIRLDFGIYHIPNISPARENNTMYMPASISATAVVRCGFCGSPAG